MKFMINDVSCIECQSVTLLVYFETLSVCLHLKLIALWMINIRDSHQYLIGLFKFEGADAGHKLLAKQCIFLAPLMAIWIYVHTNIWASDFKRFQFFEVS